MDPRRFSPSAQRNREPILAALRRHLDGGTTVLEVASGSGEHAAHFARNMPEVTFQPTDRDPEALASIDAWRAGANLPNLRPSLRLDAAEPWPALRTDTVLSLNMVHIAPWAAAEGLVRNAARILPTRGLLILYGPFIRPDRPTAASNLAFDADLRARNPTWGIRSLTAITAEATSFDPPEIVEMPANNLMLVFRHA